MSSSNIETRTRILQATVGILEKHGGRGVRMGDIASATGISRQALYLHFSSRADLLDATTRYLDEKLGLQDRLAHSREAANGVDRLARFIEFWGNYIPDIYGVAKALMLARDTDKAAAKAWQDRMQAMREGCSAAIDALHAEGKLAEPWTAESATDFLWTLLLVPNWENLTRECGWSTRQYINHINTVATRALVRN